MWLPLSSIKNILPPLENVYTCMFDGLFQLLQHVVVVQAFMHSNPHWNLTFHSGLSSSNLKDTPAQSPLGSIIYINQDLRAYTFSHIAYSVI